MELLHLKYFLTVAKTEHMTKAANELRVAQPALSKIIKNLEKELDVNLFDRIGKSIVLNESGKYFYNKVENSINILEDSVTELKEMKVPNNKKIKFLALAASFTVTDILIEFKLLYPEVELELTQSLNDEEIDFSKYDLCLFSTEPSYKYKYKDSICLLEEEILLGVSNDHILAKKNCINLSEINNEKIISLGKGNLKTLISGYCKSAGFEPNIAFESTNNALVRELISFGQGIGFLPKITWKTDEFKSIKLLHIKNPSCKRLVHLYSNDSHEYVKICKQFVVDYFKKLQK